jgi:hypothetical protein
MSSLSFYPYQRDERVSPGNLLTIKCSFSTNNKVSQFSPITFLFCSYSSTILLNYSLSLSSLPPSPRLNSIKITHLLCKSLNYLTSQITYRHKPRYKILKLWVRYVMLEPGMTSSFPFPFVPLQRWGCLVAPLFLWIVLVPCAGD